MSKFKIGDRVRRIGPDHAYVKRGGEYVVDYVSGGGGTIGLDGARGKYSAGLFELVADAATPYRKRSAELRAQAAALIKRADALDRISAVTKEVEELSKVIDQSDMAAIAQYLYENIVAATSGPASVGA